MFDFNTWNHLIVCKQISSFFKSEITYKLFTYKSNMYIYLTVCKQITDVKLNCLGICVQTNNWC